ncbi:MAG: acetyltransferase [Actinomycetota bacterium]|nr:acetyltransferase [Actinomycetota bacterium]
MALYIAGAGGFGRETLDALLACGETAAAFLDERRAGTRCRGLPVLHPEDAPEDAEFVVGIGDPAARQRLAGLLRGRGLVPRTVVHPRAVVGPETVLGPGSVVLANAHLSSSIRGGSHVQVNYNATVGHDAVLGDFVTILPGANVAGTVELGEGVTVGSNACVLQGLSIGPRTIVGAGAVVTRPIGGGELVVGIPARPRPIRRASGHDADRSHPL